MGGDLTLQRVTWAATAALSFLAALGGVVFDGIYAGLFPDEFLPGAFSQDLLTILVSILLLLLSVSTRADQIKRQVVAIALLGSLFYLYGIFTIERIYNSFYLLYAAVFALSFWSIAASVARLEPEAVANLHLSNAMLRTTAFAALFIAAVFTVLWTTALIPLMRDHNRIEHLYSIYILDLCFVMPAFVITAVMSLRRIPVGILLAPAVMIVGFFVIFPLGLNELAKPARGIAIDYGPMAVSFAFAFLMLSLGALQLRRIRFG